MPWLLLLHITALIVWCGSLLYLPGLIAIKTKQPVLKAQRTEVDHCQTDPTPRNRIAEAIPVAGTAIGNNASESPPLAQQLPAGQEISFARLVFTLVATPAALLAIAAGTSVFIADMTIEIWLLVKLTLVVGLVGCHMLFGMLVIQAERGGRARTRKLSRLLAAGSGLFMLGIMTVVLTKPWLAA